jgi:hypothetical protein
MDQPAPEGATARVSPQSESWKNGVCDKMEKKILTIMVALIVVAAIVVAFVMIAAGGMKTAGGFTNLYNDLENPNPSVTYGMYLEFPDDWEEQDSVVVSDTIVDMDPRGEELIGGVTVYTVRLYFVYIDDKWSDPEDGSLFYVPTVEHSSGYITVNHGQFWLDVSSPENIAAQYDIGDVIELKTVLEVNEDNSNTLSFGSWLLSD